MTSLTKKQWKKWLDNINCGYRESQYNGAVKILECINNGKLLNIEAPTGTGKTLMYLLAALYSQKKILISSATKLLQKQIANSIDNQVNKALIDNVNYTLLMGRNNYICKNHVLFYLQKKKDFIHEKLLISIKNVLEENLGSFGEINLIEEKLKLSEHQLSWIRNHLTTNMAICQNGECHKLVQGGENCNYKQIIDKAAGSDIIITNHHCMLKNAGVEAVSKILYSNRVFIFDEAHQIKDAAINIFRREADSYTIDKLKNYNEEILNELKDVKNSQIADKISTLFHDKNFLNLLIELDKFSDELKAFWRKWALDGTATIPSDVNSIKEYQKVSCKWEEVNKFYNEIKIFYDNNVYSRKNKELIFVLCHQFMEELKDFVYNVRFCIGRRIHDDSNGQIIDDYKIFTKNNFTNNNNNNNFSDISFKEIEDVIKVFTEGLSSSDLNDFYTSWVTCDYTSKGWAISKALLFPAFILNKVWSLSISSIFLSATITTEKNNFNWFARNTGIVGEEQFILDEVFDYKKQCKIFVANNPDEIPFNVMETEKYIKSRAKLFGHSIIVTQGRTLILYTSNERLWGLNKFLNLSLNDYTIYSQLESNDHDLLARKFKEEEKSSLNSTRAFFQGFDAPGSTLSCLILEKLPFDNISDPIIKGQKKAYLIEEAASGNNTDWFTNEYMPQMVITFRQAIGRLIRTTNDFGIIVLADNRIVDSDKSYSQLIFKSINLQENQFIKIDSSEDIINENFDIFFPFDRNKAEIKQNIEKFNSIFDINWGKASEDIRFRKLTKKPSLVDVLKRLKIEHLYDWQEKIISSIVDEKTKQQLVVYPTGSGKSLIYQVSGLLLEGITIVISPLISLMQDQVESLWSKGVMEATFINSSLSDEVKRERFINTKNGFYKLLYVAPERLFSESFLKMLNNVPGGVSLMVVDETHMITEVGHNFRPLYCYLRTAREKLKNPQLIALTATAGKRVKKDICLQFDVDQEQIRYDSIVRSSVRIEVKKIMEISEHYDECYKIVNEAKGRPVIIYCATILYSFSLRNGLRERGLDPNKILMYNSTVPSDTKAENHKKFLNDEANVMIATTAYGMGIDKPNIWCVVYNNMPLTIEEFVQGGGRVCRDRALLSNYLNKYTPSKCLLIYRTGDYYLRKKSFIDIGFNEQKDKFNEIILKIKNDKNYFPRSVKKVGQENDLKCHQILLQFLKKENRISDFYYDWSTSENEQYFRVERNNISKKLISKSIIEKFNESRDSFHKNQIDALDAVCNFVNTDGCKNIFLQNYFGEKEPEDTTCFICDSNVCSPMDADKHLKYVSLVSKTFAPEKTDPLKIISYKSFVDYTDEIINNKEFTAKIAHLKKLHRDIGETETKYSFAEAMINIRKINKQKKSDEENIRDVAKLAKSALYLGDEFKEIGIQIIKDNKLEAYLKLFECERPYKLVDAYYEIDKGSLSEFTVETRDNFREFLNSKEFLPDKYLNNCFNRKLDDLQAIEHFTAGHYPTEHSGYTHLLGIICKSQNVNKIFTNFVKKEGERNSYLTVISNIVDILEDNNKSITQKYCLNILNLINEILSLDDSFQILMLGVLEHYNLSDWWNLCEKNDSPETHIKILFHDYKIYKDVPKDIEVFLSELEKVESLVKNVDLKRKGILKLYIKSNPFYSLDTYLVKPYKINNAIEFLNSNKFKNKAYSLEHFELLKSMDFKDDFLLKNREQLLILIFKIFTYIKESKEKFQFIVNILANIRHTEWYKIKNGMNKLLEDAAYYCEQHASYIKGDVNKKNLFLLQSALLQSLTGSKQIEIEGKPISADESFLKDIFNITDSSDILLSVDLIKRERDQLEKELLEKENETHCSLLGKNGYRTIKGLCNWSDFKEFRIVALEKEDGVYVVLFSRDIINFYYTKLSEKSLNEFVQSMEEDELFFNRIESKKSDLLKSSLIEKVSCIHRYLLKREYEGLPYLYNDACQESLTLKKLIDLLI